MSSDHPLASIDASVERVAVENHPLAAGAMTANIGSPLQSNSPPRSEQNFQQNNTNAAIPTGTVSPPGPFAHPNSIANNVSPSKKSIDELADEFLSSKPPPILLRPNPLPRGEVGIVRLRTLVVRRAWGDVLKLASTLLNNDASTKKKSSSSLKNKQYAKVYASLLYSGQDSAVEPIDEVPNEVRQETVEILMLRCHALLKLRRYSDLAKEVGQWKFLKQNDVAAPLIEWLPWGIHILAGQSREYSDDAKHATDILCHLREDIPSTECGCIASLDNALSNIYIRRGEWRLALGSLDRVIDLIPEVAKAEVRSILVSNQSNVNLDKESEETLTSFLIKTYVCEILSRQGRIFLQIGAISEAREVFEVAKTIWSHVESADLLSSISVSEDISNRNNKQRVVIESLLEINDGLLSFSESNYDEALESFSKAIELLREESKNFYMQYYAQDWLGSTIESSQAPSLMYNEAVNNVSLCHLYMCNMNQGVDVLEALIREDPTAFLTERVAFNLCTLYELGSDSSVAVRKKRVLQLIAKRFFLHDVGPENFRIT